MTERELVIVIVVLVVGLVPVGIWLLHAMRK